MPSPVPQTYGLRRSLSWPPPTRTAIERKSTKCQAEPESMLARERIRQPDGFFQADVDINADSLFSSPINEYEYEGWTSDSDDDSDDIEWDAGITDFALFDDDRRRAQETNERLPSKWNPMLDRQNSALERAAVRSRAISELDSSEQLSLTTEDVPGLTPDDSPDLRDDLDEESNDRPPEVKAIVSKYLAMDIDSSRAYDFDEARLTNIKSSLVMSAMSKESRHQETRRRERPGLRHSRTMSGYVHSWKRPSMHMYTLGEEPDAEWMEELSMI